MSLTTDSQRKIALKAVSGKAHTKNARSIYEEPISTTLASHSKSVFADPIPTPTATPSLYDINGVCEYVRFDLEYIENAGSTSYWTTDNEVVGSQAPDNDTGVEYKTLPSSYDGRHAFAIKLPPDYQDNSTNPNKALAKYANGCTLHESGYRLQIVGVQHGAGYFPKLYKGAGAGATEIPHDDERDWSYDPVAGILVQQDPPGPGDWPDNPTYLEGWLYIGEYLDENISTLSGSISSDLDLIREDIETLQSQGGGGDAVDNDFVVKKLRGKAHTNPNKRHYNEAIASYIYSNASHIPSSAPPVIGTTPYNYYHIEGSKVEYLRLSGSYVDSGQSVDGRHGIKLHLPNDYQANTSNPLVGSGYWFNGRSIHGTSGSIQMVPPYFNDNDSNYEGKVYYHDGVDYVQIPPEDERTWRLDYQAGILYQDTPEDDAALDPVVVDAWVWVGGMVSEGVGSGGGGGGGGDGTIGAAEDGTYTDGLFTDFTSATPIGTAIDRFNEVLKALAPPPAPTVRAINYSVSGGSTYSGLLSFDGSHPDPGGLFTSVSTYQQQGQPGFDGIGVNDLYASDSKTIPNANFDGSDLHFWRVGILTGTQTISGEVNFNVPQLAAATGVVQYTEDCFGDGDIGSLLLEVNGTVVHTLDLTNFPGDGVPPNGVQSSESVNGNGSGFTHISELRSGFTEGGSEFEAFKHRTANYKIVPAEMQKGFNRARVIHSKGGNNYYTNYVEWLIDDTSDVISFANSTVSPTNPTGDLSISGVRYHSGLTLNYSVDVNNLYVAVHSPNNITTNTSVGTAAAQPIDPIGVGEDMSKVLSFANTASLSASNGSLFGQAVDLSITVPHPIKGSKTGGEAQTNLVLLYTTTSNATQTSEDFSLEEFRLQNGNYATQPAAITSGWFEATEEWDSTLHMSGSNAGHEDGLQIYDGRLLSPVNTIPLARQGDFRNISDGGVLETYDDNPDYSSDAGNITGTRTYYRYFRNTTNFAQRDLRILYNGNTNLTTSGGAFDTGNIKVAIKFPTNEGGTGTGWMDANSPYGMFLYGDDDGASIGALDTSVTNLTTNYITFGQREVQPDEVILVRIQADTTWTGNLTSLEVQWGASDSGNTAPGNLAITAQELQQVSINDTGVEGKLSFGASNAVGGYTNVDDTDFNQVYGVSGYQRGIFSSVTADGILNDTLNDRFDDAELGTLQLEVNGVLVPDSLVDLTNLTASGDFLDANGTGFTNISVATPSVYASNGLPSYNNIYRTGGVVIQPASQRQGWNYYRAIHTIGVEQRITNFCEWVIDGDNAQYDITNAEMDDWSDTTTNYQSGIGYFGDPNTEVRYRANGVYTNIYSNANDAVGWTNLTRVNLLDQDIVGAGIENKTGVTSDTTSLPNLLVGGETSSFDVTGSLDWTGASRVMPGTLGTNSGQTASIRGRVKHPLKGDQSSATLSKTDFLIGTFTNTSTVHGSETFDSETYRMPDGTYATATDITGASWDSTISVVGGTVGYDNALVQYNGNLVAPSKAGNNGDFTTVADGGTFQGPAGNPDYSDVASQTTERIYLRSFHNIGTSDYANLDVDITGVGVLGSENQISNPAGDIGANTTFKMFVKLVEPNGNINTTTGWLDCGEQATGGNQDFDGCSLLPIAPTNQLAANIQSTTSIPLQLPTGRFLYGTLSTEARNYLIIKIVAHKSWTGRITSLGVSF